MNSLGFRGPEINKTKAEGTFRVVTLGDSTTFGLYGYECPYPAQLQDELQAYAEDYKVEVVNGGVEGYGTRRALRLLRTRVREIEPDVVTIYLGWNDIYFMDPFQSNLPELHARLGQAEREADPGARRWVAEAIGESYVVHLCGD